MKKTSLLKWICMSVLLALLVAFSILSLWYAMSIGSEGGNVMNILLALTSAIVTAAYIIVFIRAARLAKRG